MAQDVFGPAAVVHIQLAQILCIIMAADEPDAGIICFIVNAIIMKRTQQSQTDGFKQIHPVGHIVIAQCIQIPAVQPVRRGGQPQQKLGPEVFQNPPVGAGSRMVEFYEHHEVHTIFSALTQKYPLSKEHKGYFIMQVSFLKIYTPQVSPKLFTGVFLINKGSSITKGFIYLQVSFATKNGKRLGLSALYKGHFWKLKWQI